MRAFLYIIVSILIVMPFKGVSQKYKNKEVSLISFTISIHPETKIFLDQFENQFQSVKNNNADKIISKIKEQAWGSLVDSLQQGMGMIILPISTFGAKIGYDAYNFPDVSITRAQRIGYSRFYIRIDLAIGPEILPPNSSFKTKNDTALQKLKIKEGEIKPVVTLTITCYPENGILPVGKYIGSAQASTVWISENASILDGLVNTDVKTDLSTLMSLINEAIFDAIINMQIK